MEIFGFEVYHEYIIEYVEAVEHIGRALRVLIIYFDLTLHPAPAGFVCLIRCALG